MTMPLSSKHDIQQAITQFWATRKGQGKRQGASGKTSKDRGNRASVTGGKQLDGFVNLLIKLLTSAGVNPDSIMLSTGQVILPGYFRPTKQWDLLVIVNGKLLAVLELKSQFGSLGNNANNRAEEAIGNAQDFWTAYREGAFKESPRPWLGYLFLLEDSDKSCSAVKTNSPHFPIFQEFEGASYVDRYTILCRRLIRERLYDAAALLVTSPIHTTKGEYREPEKEATFEYLARSLVAHVITHNTIQ